MKIEIKGLDQLTRKLEDLQRRAENLSGNVPTRGILTPAFLRKHSRFSSIEEMFEASGFKVETQDDFKNIPDQPWDEFIAKETTFPNWKEMLSAAGGEYAKRKLGFS
jgi:hypothetical protein